MKTAATATASQEEALISARSRSGTMNYGAILSGFSEMGIKIEEIRPRENVFTFKAWLALGRVVKKGQHGVKVCTFIPASSNDKKTGEVKNYRMPRATTVFHVSQTQELEQA